MSQSATISSLGFPDTSIAFGIQFAYRFGLSLMYLAMRSVCDASMLKINARSTWHCNSRNTTIKQNVFFNRTVCHESTGGSQKIESPNVLKSDGLCCAVKHNMRDRAKVQYAYYILCRITAIYILHSKPANFHANVHEQQNHMQAGTGN